MREVPSDPGARLPRHDSADGASSSVLGFLRDLVRLESTPGKEERAVRRVVAEMRQLGFDEAFVDDAGNAVGRCGSGSPVVLIDCHIDTIPLHSGDQWVHDPLAGEVADGRIWGLGACDMKGSAAAAIYGVAELAAAHSVSGTVIVVCSIAEEMMEGAALRSTVEAFPPDIVIIGEPTDLRVCTGQRGRAKLEVTVQGRSSHAAHPAVGLNAAERMGELIAAVAQLPHPQHPVLGPRLLTCIDVHSEPYPSVSTIPGNCGARFDARFGPEETPESLVELITGQARVWDELQERPSVDVRVAVAEFETYLGHRYSVPEFAPAWYIDPDTPPVRAALAAVEAVGIPPLLATYGFCTNGGLTGGTLGIPTIGFGVGREQDAHAVDESIEIAQLIQAMNGFRSLADALTACSPHDLAAV